MITRVYLKNFRGIGEETVELGSMTALVGKNGAGKSSFMEVLPEIEWVFERVGEKMRDERHRILREHPWPENPVDRGGGETGYGE